MCERKCGLGGMSGFAWLRGGSALWRAGRSYTEGRGDAPAQPLPVFGVVAVCPLEEGGVEAEVVFMVEVRQSGSRLKSNDACCWGYDVPEKVISSEDAELEPMVNEGCMLGLA